VKIINYPSKNTVIKKRLSAFYELMPVESDSAHSGSTRKIIDGSQREWLSHPLMLVISSPRGANPKSVNLLRTSVIALAAVPNSMIEEKIQRTQALNNLTV
jgi:hypothetical protein